MVTVIWSTAVSGRRRSRRKRRRAMADNDPDALTISPEKAFFIIVKAREFDDVLKSGRTHLQDAAPVRLGQEFSGYARQADLSVVRANKALKAILELPLGGTAVKFSFTAVTMFL